MNNIFPAEKNDGLEEQLKSDTSIAYCLEPVFANNERTKAFFNEFNVGDLAEAATKDEDLFYVPSILVSTSWNDNDDVFGPIQTWAAKDTPVNKPTNLNHDQNNVVGHIISSFGVDRNYKLIANSTSESDLPDFFHILVGSVVYRDWDVPALQERAEKLIAEIEAGTKCVSMECRFGNFDYAVIKPDNSFSILSRNKETAFLTKHLRRYGGTGSFEGHKVGRFLQRIRFVGKGFVDNPANSYSTIFNNVDQIPFAAAGKNDINLTCGVSSTMNAETILAANNEKVLEKGNSNMSEIFEKQVAELKGQVEKLTVVNEELRNDLAKADVAKLQDRITELEAEVTAAKANDESKVADIADLTSKLDEAKASLAEVNTAKASLEEELATVKAAEVKAQRVSLLVDGGMDKSKAEETIVKFENLDEAQFSVVAETLIAALPPFLKKKKDGEEEETDDKKKKKDDKKSKADDSVDTELNADDVVVDDKSQADLNVNDDDAKSEHEKVQAELAEWAQQYVS